MKWSERAWQSVGDIYEEILNLPFLKELMSGELTRERFEFYIAQDALYLAEYGKVLCGIATKLTNTEDQETFINFARDTMHVERALHSVYVKELESVNVRDISPTCMLYSSFLLGKLAVAPVEVIVAAVLPCFRIYKEVGDYIIANHADKSNPYNDWIETYGGEEFAQAVEKAEAIADKLASDSDEKMQEEMTHTYMIASKMEWMFWESAWQIEKWKI